jgi:predicted nucleotidyltransferase component of viral defense system
MLYLNTITPTTHQLLLKLMQIPELENFALVGGTNLSLRYGHRLSIDLDLFTNQPFDRDEVFSAVIRHLPQALKLDERRQTIWMIIDSIKVDIILHEYPYIEPVETLDGIRLVATEDIIPMKLEAMATRGVKKDFWDIAELLNHFSLSQTNSDIGHIILSMTYFADAELQKEDPQDLKGVTWEAVKTKMKRTVSALVKGQL